MSKMKRNINKIENETYQTEDKMSRQKNKNIQKILNEKYNAKKSAIIEKTKMILENAFEPMTITQIMKELKPLGHDLDLQHVIKVLYLTDNLFTFRCAKRTIKQKSVLILFLYHKDFNYAVNPLNNNSIRVRKLNYFDTVYNKTI